VSGICRWSDLINADGELFSRRLGVCSAGSARRSGAIGVERGAEEPKCWVAAIVERPSARQDESIGMALADHTAVGVSLIFNRRHPEHQAFGHHSIHERRWGGAPWAIALPPHGGEP